MIHITGLTLNDLEQFAKFCGRFHLRFPKSDYKDIDRLISNNVMESDDLVDVYIIGNRMTWYPIYITIPDAKVSDKIDYKQFIYNLENDLINEIKGNS